MLNVIVTGGSRGIGLGTARKLVTAGYRVIVIGRSQNDAFAAAMHEAEAVSPGSLQFISFDLAEIEGISDLVKKIRKEYGPIYGLVNNAGISFDGAFALMPLKQIEQLVRVNTISPIVLSRFVVGAMMADKGGRIINLASIAAFTGYSGLSVYSATKASLLGFTRSLAREVGRMGINVNAVAPGFIETDMTSGLKDEQRQRIERRSALRRLPEVDDIANAIEYLLSDKARNITGTILTIDAGNSA